MGAAFTSRLRAAAARMISTTLPGGCEGPGGDGSVAFGDGRLGHFLGATEGAVVSSVDGEEDEADGDEAEGGGAVKKAIRSMEEVEAVKPTAAEVVEEADETEEPAPKRRRPQGWQHRREDAGANVVPEKSKCSERQILKHSLAYLYCHRYSHPSNSRSATSAPEFVLCGIHGVLNGP